MVLHATMGKRGAASNIVSKRKRVHSVEESVIEKSVLDRRNKIESEYGEYVTRPTNTAPEKIEFEDFVYSGNLQISYFCKPGETVDIRKITLKPALRLRVVKPIMTEDSFVEAAVILDPTKPNGYLLVNVFSKDVFDTNKDLQAYAMEPRTHSFFDRNTMFAWYSPCDRSDGSSYWAPINRHSVDSNAKYKATPLHFVKEKKVKTAGKTAQPSLSFPKIQPPLSFSALMDSDQTRNILNNMNPNEAKRVRFIPLYD